jgi:ubiquinol-cytochrome c reductase cytochrome b subunit
MSASWRTRLLASPALAWLEARLDLTGPLARELDRPGPVAASWTELFWRHLGALCLLLLLLQGLTGLALLPFYRASPGEALASLLGIEQGLPAGWLARRLHAVGGHLLVILAWLHALRALARGEHLAPRDLPWLTGWLLFVAGLVTLYSGGLLPQSQASLGMLQALWPGGGALNAGVLGWALAAHLGLPLLAAPLVWLHLTLARRAGGRQAGEAAPQATGQGAAEPRLEPFFPQGLINLGLALAGGLLLLTALAVLWPQPFLAPARPLPPPGQMGLPGGVPWYLWAPGLLATWLPPGWGLALILLLLFAPGLAPFWDRGPARPLGQRPWLGKLLPLALVLWALASLWGAWRL